MPSAYGSMQAGKLAVSVREASAFPDGGAGELVSYTDICDGRLVEVAATVRHSKDWPWELPTGYPTTLRIILLIILQLGTKHGAGGRFDSLNDRVSAEGQQHQSGWRPLTSASGLITAVTCTACARCAYRAASAFTAAVEQ
jgi:hypothetical protein